MLDLRASVESAREAIAEKPAGWLEGLLILLPNLILALLVLLLFGVARAVRRLGP